MTLWAAAGAVLAGRPRRPVNLGYCTATSFQRSESQSDVQWARFSPVSTCNFPRRATLQALAAFLSDQTAHGTEAPPIAFRPSLKRKKPRRQGERMAVGG